MARLTDLADTALIRSSCSFPCIDEVRALPHVAGFPDLRVIRPAPTAARPPKPLPGFAGYRPGIASRRPAGDRGRDGSPGFPRRPFARSTPNTPEGSSAPAPGPRAPSMAFAVLAPARHPLFPRPKAGSLTTLTQASLTLQTARSLRPASHPTSRSRTGASLPGTQASPRTGLTPAGHRELVAPTSYGPPFPHDAGAVPAHASTRAAASPGPPGLLHQASSGSAPSHQQLPLGRRRTGATSPAVTYADR